MDMPSWLRVTGTHAEAGQLVYDLVVDTHSVQFLLHMEGVLKRNDRLDLIPVLREAWCRNRQEEAQVADGMLDISVDAGDLAAMSRLRIGNAVLTAHLVSELDEIAREAIAIVQSHMQFDKGYATGDLEGSLEVGRPSELERTVSTENEHAKFVEYGTGQRGASSDAEPEDGYDYGPKPGMEAEPYMAPAMPDIEIFAEIRLRNAVEFALEEIAHG